MHELFEAQVAANAGSHRVEFEAERITYRELDERANRLAHALVRRGVAAGNVVAVCMDRCVEMVVALYACSRPAPRTRRSTRRIRRSDSPSSCAI